MRAPKNSSTPPITEPTEPKQFVRLTHPVAHDIAKVLVDDLDIRQLNEAERKDFIDFLGYFTYAVRKIVTLLDQNKDQPELIELLGIACLSFSAAALIDPVARDRFLDSLKQMQTAPGRAKRSTKTELGRKLVYECIVRLFNEKPDFRDKRPNRIATEIERDNDIEKMLKDYPASERPRLKHSSIRKRVEEYLAERDKSA